MFVTIVNVHYSVDSCYKINIQLPWCNLENGSSANLHCTTLIFNGMLVLGRTQSKESEMSDKLFPSL